MTKNNKSKAIFGAATLVLAGVVAGGFLSFGNKSNASNMDSEYAPLSYEVVEEDSAGDFIDPETEQNEDVFIPEAVSANDILRTEYNNLKSNEDNSDRAKSDLLDEATALSKLNHTDNKNWDGKVELWVDGQGWVDASTLSDEEIARITGADPVAPAETTSANTTPKNGHYEEVWVEDIPGFYDDELKEVAYYVCNGCESVLGKTEADMDAHCRPAMLEGRLECGSWRIDYKLEPTGNRVYVEPKGHYKKVWVED